MNQLHEEVFSFFEKFRKKHPELLHALRQKNNNKRLENGFWFQGTETYAFVGLYNRGGGMNMTHSVGLVFWYNGDNISCTLENAFKGEKDLRIIDFYSQMRKTVGGFDDKISDKYKLLLSDTNGFEAAERFIIDVKPKIDDLVKEMNLDLLFFKEKDFNKSIKRINELRVSNEVTVILANITWNSNDWQGASDDKSNHAWVADGNTAHESWNFDFANKRNNANHIFGYAKFTNPPKVAGINNLVIFYSNGQIVGFYGQTEILKETVSINKNESYNIIGDRNLCVLLKNKIENVKEKGYLDGKDRVGRIGFNYINDLSVVSEILDEAIELNPTERASITRIKDWLNIEEKSHTDMAKNNNLPLNQILFGPPGTGKTYNTINKAIEIINPLFNLSQEREAVKKEFDRLINEGNIVFTTFHQSMSYEDFIEGIKPQEPKEEGDPISYRIEWGVFRNICTEAAFSIAQQRKGKVTEDVLDFSMLYDYFVESAEEELARGQKVELKTKAGNTVMIDSISPQSNIIIKHIDGTRTYTVSKARLTKLQANIGDLDDVININHQFRDIIGGSNASAYWAVLNAIRAGKHEIPKTLNEKEIRNYTFDDRKEAVLTLSKDDYKNQRAKPFVLIIDEINRGNISQIFGELITLIEEDKRLGKEEALELVLPYSKERFGVPPNLYIIGTMNTADRSVESLDTALRRRFSFIEMPPISSVLENKQIDDVDIVKLLDTINARIEKLIDKDHKIGHAHFMGIKTLDELKLTFQDNIIPLLEEYFFGDYGKIGLILGDSFVEKVSDSDFQFATFADYDQYDLKERSVFRIKERDKWDFKSIYQNG